MNNMQIPPGIEDAIETEYLVSKILVLQPGKTRDEILKEAREIAKTGPHIVDVLERLYRKLLKNDPAN